MQIMINAEELKEVMSLLESLSNEVRATDPYSDAMKFDGFKAAQSLRERMDDQGYEFDGK